MAAPEPTPPEPGHNRLAITTPFGSITAGGRDVILIALVVAVGAGSVAVQWHSFRQFEAQMVKAIDQIQWRTEATEQQRAELLQLLRVRICSDQFFIEVRQVPDPVVREALWSNWQAVCVGTESWNR